MECLLPEFKRSNMFLTFAVAYFAFKTKLKRKTFIELRWSFENVPSQESKITDVLCPGEGVTADLHEKVGVGRGYLARC